MRAGVDFEGVRDAVSVEGLVELLRVGPQAVLVSHVDGNSAVPAQVSDVLIEEGEGLDGQLRWPSSLCIGEAGYLAVADRENNRVSTFVLAP